jgi:predicted TIM-barrel fold metal-dependent hydrolase
MADTVGAPLGEPGFRLIDADAHINEPPDLWTSRVPAEFRDRAPRIERLERGDAWVMEGVTDPINFGLNAAAGLPAGERRPWVRFEDIRRGGYDPKVRLEEMDLDFVDACVLYPTPRVSQLVIATREPDFHLALVQAYNDWLSEYCGYDPTRLGGIMLVPNRGVADAVAEVRRVAGRPGMVGALIGCYPHGDLNLTEEDDAVWQAVATAGVPLHIHVKLVNDQPKDMYAPGVVTEGHAEGDLRFLQAPVRMVQFVNGGVFDRVPDLEVVLAEVDAGWVPYVKEQLDNRLLRRGIGSDIRDRQLPSRIIEEHFSYTYITDHFAIRNRHAIGVDRLMWSSDYPHSGSDWPNSVRVIHADFADVPAHERDLILAGNARRLYGFGS